MTKTITAILATMIMVVGGFTYPLAYMWYCDTYLSGNKTLSGFLPFMMSFILWIGIVAGVAYLWMRVFDKKLK